MNEPVDRRLRLISAGTEEERWRIIAALDDPTIRIVLGPQPGLTEQLLAIALCDLLGRVFPRIAVDGTEGIDADPGLPPGPGVLAERIEQARGHGHRPLAAGEHASLTIAVGPAAGTADLHVDGEGWQSYIGTQPSRLPAEGRGVLPVGPLIAACRGAAHAFAQLLAELRPALDLPAGVYSSALTYRHSEEPLEAPGAVYQGTLDDVLVGAGSVGGAFAYLLARVSGLSGDLAIVDPQTLEADNLDRAILANAADAVAERVKAHVARDALSHLPDLRVDARQLTIAQYLASRPREQPLPPVCCAVDSSESRREIQDCLPLELINAACSQSDVMVSGHYTDKGPCVCCLHMREVLDGQPIRARLIAAATGLPFGMIIAWLIQRVPLDAHALRGIEQNTSRPSGSLAGYEGRTVEDLWREQLMYGAARVGGQTGAAAQVAAPWVTAAAGFLLAAETLKRSDPSLHAACLGPGAGSPAIHYAESPYASPAFAMLSNPPRWAGTECLCNSPRRRRLLHERYRL